MAPVAEVSMFRESISHSEKAVGSIPLEEVTAVSGILRQFTTCDVPVNGLVVHEPKTFAEAQDVILNSQEVSSGATVILPVPEGFDGELITVQKEAGFELYHLSVSIPLSFKLLGLDIPVSWGRKLGFNIERLRDLGLEFSRVATIEVLRGTKETVAQLFPIILAIPDEFLGQIIEKGQYGTGILLAAEPKTDVAKSLNSLGVNRMILTFTEQEKKISRIQLELIDDYGRFTGRVFNSSECRQLAGTFIVKSANIWV